jgi:hypothetical protein
MVLQLPHDCHVRDVHKKDKYQVHLENTKITISGGGDIAIGPSEAPMAPIKKPGEERVLFNRFL